MDSSNAHGCARNAEKGFDFDFLEWYLMSMNFSVTSYEYRFHLWMLKPKEPSKLWMHTHSPNRPKKFKRMFSACQKADGNCLLGQKRSADGGIHATRDHSNIRSVLRNTMKLHRAVQNKRHGVLTSGVLLVLLHDNACSRTAACTGALQEHFNWQVFDHPP
jgi:hypothetical protein